MKDASTEMPPTTPGRAHDRLAQAKHSSGSSNWLDHFARALSAGFLSAALLLAGAPNTSAGSATASATMPVEVEEIAPGIFVFQGAYELFTPHNAGAISNAGFIIGNEAVAVIDTGGSKLFGERLKAAIRLHTTLPVKYVINTHMHPDHVFGNAAFLNEKPLFTGHFKLAPALTARKDQYLQANKILLGKSFEDVQIVLPSLEVKEPVTIDLGDRKLILEAHPTAHTDNDLTILDERTGTLFMGDLLFSVHLPVVDGSIRGWRSLMSKMASRNLKGVVPGHGPATMSWPDALTAQDRYLATLVKEIRTYIEKGIPLAQAAREVGLEEKTAWALFDDFNARNVSAAYAELEWE